MDWKIVSDGAVEKNSRGGCACIVSNAQAERRLKLAVMLDFVDSSEAELFGAVYGLAVVVAATRKRLLPESLSSKIVWFCDNQTIVETANLVIASQEPSRKMPLIWRTLLLLSSSVEFEARHLRSDLGDRQQLACDRASRWVSRSGNKLLQRFGQGPIGRLRRTEPENAWQLVEGCSGLAEAKLDLDDLLAKMPKIVELSAARFT